MLAVPADLARGDVAGGIILAAFSVREGRAAARQADSLFLSYLAVVLGVILHFVWEILVGVLRTGDDPDFGTAWMLIARGVVAGIVAAVSFIGIWKQLEAADPKIRFFVALSQGFALDALASPIAPAVGVDGA